MIVQCTGTSGLAAHNAHRSWPLLPRMGQATAVLAGSIGLVVFAATRRLPIDVSWSVRIAIFGVGALALWLGLVAALGERDPAYQNRSPGVLSRLGAALAHGTRRAYLGALPLAALPLTLGSNPRAAAWLVPTLLATSAFCLCLCEVCTRSGTPGHTASLPFTPRSHSTTVRFGGWEIGSLVFCVCAAGWFFIVGSNCNGSGDNDAAYYFGVARHIVRTGRFEEPIVWHFLAPSDSVVHAPFDYWQGLTTIALLPTMALFEPTHRVALLTMAGISSAGLLLFWYLIAVAAPLRHRIAQAVGLLTFAASPALKDFRFDTETVPVFHVALLLALIALAKGRVLIAACAAFCLYLTRGDGIVLCCLLWGACFVWQRNEPRSLPAARPVLALLGTIALLLVAHVAWCTVLYGVPLPPGSVAGATIAQYVDLYSWGKPVTPGAWSVRFNGIPARVWTAWDNLRTIPFLPQQALFAGLTLALGWRRSRWRFTGLLWLLLFVGSGLVVVAVGIVFSAGRTLYTMAPLALLVTAAAVDHLFDGLARWRRQSPRPRVLELLVLFSAVALIGGPMLQLRPYGVRADGYPGLEDKLRGLEPHLKGEVLASMNPFHAIAVTNSPAIMIPMGDAATIEEAFRHYRVRWLALSASNSCFGEAEVTCEKIRKAETTSLGALRITRTTSVDDLTLYRVEETPETPAPKVRRARTPS